MPDTPALATLRAFVEGQVSVADFEQQLYHAATLEALLNAHPAPSYSAHAATLYQHLIGLDYRNPDAVMNAQAVLQRLLQSLGIDAQPDTNRAETHALLLAAQPRWLEADLGYLATLLDEAPVLSAAERKRWLKQRILECFRCAGKPPRWLQSARWPMGEQGPLVFLGQCAVENYFHDSAAVYVFHDPANGQVTTITQVM